MEIGTWRHGDRERACEEWRPREEWWEGRLLRPRGGEFSWGLRFCQWLSLSLCTPSRTSLLLLSLASRTPPLPTPHESHQLSPFPFSSFLSLSNALSLTLFVFFQNVNVRTGGLKWGISIFITVWGKKSRVGCRGVENGVGVLIVAQRILFFWISKWKFVQIRSLLVFSYYIIY